MIPGPVRDLTSFAEALRSEGLTVTPDQVSDMARSLGHIDIADRDQVYAALRALSITDPAHRLAFDEVFRQFFEGFRRPGAKAEQPSRLASSQAMTPLIQTTPESEISETQTEAGASAVENLERKDFADLDDDELVEARRLVMSMVWEPTDFKTRRWLRAKAGSKPDLRKTLHGAVGPEGDLMQIALKKRRLRQRPLIIIADISGSMEKYADLFLVFAHAAQTRLDNVEVFTFSTELTRITDDLKKRDTKTALSSVTHTVRDWSGGTKIGETLASWNKQWSRRLARGGPVALILSDGWDCGEPSLLSEEMARLARSVHMVIWLNPLAGRAEYRPATRGMKAVLPHIDHLLPAASVHDLKGVVGLLDSVSRKAV